LWCGLKDRVLFERKKRENREGGLGGKREEV
jgi:hypothetical protein